MKRIIPHEDRIFSHLKNTFFKSKRNKIEFLGRPGGPEERERGLETPWPEMERKTVGFIMVDTSSSKIERF